jgi:arylsulfatase A-like enzyme
LAFQTGKVKAAPRPNVLFIAIDDLNDWIGCLGGHPDTKTPNIDRLARRGIVFTRCYCSAPACNPSRASLLTGVRPSTSGVYRNNQPWRPAMPGAVTLPHHFKNNGYKVFGRGKIFHGGHSKDMQAWHTYIDQGPDPKPDNRPLNGIKGTAHFDWGPLGDEITDEDMDDTKVANWAADFLHQDHEKPFFLACGLYRPHLPWYNPKKYHDMFPPESVTLPEVNEEDLNDVPEPGVKMARPQGDHKKVTETNNWKKAVSGYLASIAFTDANVGRILDALEKSKYNENTIIVLWGDHGWHLGEKLHWRKFALWEEATRMPLIISLPNSPHQNVKCNRTVTLLDLYPTLSSLCGLPAQQQCEGHNLKPLLDNPQSPWKYPALTTYKRNNHTIRSERWRYIEYEDGSQELYDHQNDPLEWNNLASDSNYADIIKQHKKWLPETNAAEAKSKKK